MTAGLFGINRSNVDLSKPAGWGKNKFNNTFPVALLAYMDHVGIDPAYIFLAKSRSRKSAETATVTKKGRISPEGTLGIDPARAGYHFESTFEPFRKIVNGEVNNSDVVVVESASGRQVRALEIKLVVVPDSSTTKRSRELQSCEIVSRPLMIENVALNICQSFAGDAARAELLGILNAYLQEPNSWRWEQPADMKRLSSQVVDAFEAVLAYDTDRQRPMILQPIWRTEGQSARLDPECFDVFVWSDYAFTRMLLDSATFTRQGTISRPLRSIIWIVRMLWDYATTGKVNPRSITHGISLIGQTDKAGSFNGTITHRYLSGDELAHPRLGPDSIAEIVLGEGLDYLAPERRFDAAVHFGQRS